jgi:hypothetical protein
MNKENNFWAIGRCPDDDVPVIADEPASWRPWQGPEQHDEHVLDYWKQLIR